MDISTTVQMPIAFNAVINVQLVKNSLIIVYHVMEALESIMQRIIHACISFIINIYL